MGCRSSSLARSASNGRGDDDDGIFQKTIADAAMQDAFTQIFEGTSDQTYQVPLLYPMYVMSMKTLMELERMEPHQKLLKQGLLVKWTPKMYGRVIFVSHEWLGYKHPDPANEQLDCLKSVLRRLMSGKESVSNYYEYKLAVLKDDTVNGDRWRKLADSYVWLDFAGVPQICAADVEENGAAAGTDHRFGTGGAIEDLKKAVDSIPAYVERSSLMLVLAPVVQHHDADRVCNFASWRGRGWCRLELQATMLCRSSVRILRCPGPEAPLFFIGSLDALRLPSGEGNFTCCSRGHVIDGTPIPCDKLKIRGVLDIMMHSTVAHFKNIGDYDHMRCLLCSRGRFLRGLPLEDDQGKAHVSAGDSVEAFSKFMEWRPEDDKLAAAGNIYSLFHWACFGGYLEVVRVLLAEGNANVLKRTPHQVQKFALPGGYQSIHLAVQAPDNAVAIALELIRAKADPTKPMGNMIGLTPLCQLAGFSTVDQLLMWKDHFPDADFNETDKMGNSALCHALLQRPSSAPMVKALLEARANLMQDHPMAGPGGAVFSVCGKQDSDPEAVKLLLDAGLPVNCQACPRSGMARGLFALMRSRWLWKGGMQGNLPGCFSEVLAFAGGSTPLMYSTRGGDIEVTKLLLARNADAGMRNFLGFTALDITRHFFGGRGPAIIEDLLRDGENSEDSREVVVDVSA